jgi:hypothetical protein
MDSQDQEAQQCKVHQEVVEDGKSGGRLRGQVELGLPILMN